MTLTTYALIAETKAADLYAAGPAYFAHARRVAKNSTFAEDDVTIAAERQRLRDLAVRDPVACN